MRRKKQWSIKYLPFFKLLTGMFFTTIAHAGQKPNTTFRNQDAGSIFSLSKLKV